MTHDIHIADFDDELLLQAMTDAGRTWLSFWFPKRAFDNAAFIPRDALTRVSKTAPELVFEGLLP